MEVVLVLEDDPAVQEVLRAILRRNGFKVEVAATADRTLAQCKQHRGAIGMLIADVHLPSRSGTEAAVEIREHHPDIPILFTSGTPMEYWNDADRRNVERLPRDSFCFVQKPFTCWALMEKVGGLLPRFQLARTA